VVLDGGGAVDVGFAEPDEEVDPQAVQPSATSRITIGTVRLMRHLRFSAEEVCCRNTDPHRPAG
jgi:hypothetical protein